ncbi:MAG: hypothetical protein K2X47_15950, partial [Bdellovibrionales bacterium]|nr:hypothetical protein [Bdellovibrionales bacterium]
MHKKAFFKLISTASVLVFLVLGFNNCAPVSSPEIVPSPQSQSTDAIISVTSSTSGNVAPQLSGFNAPQLNNSASYLDPNFINVTKELSPGWIRFPAGVAGMAYNWSTGQLEGAWVTQNATDFGDASLNQMLTAAQKLTFAKGGVSLTDFTYFVNQLGSNVDSIVSFNTFTDTNSNTTRNMYNAAAGLGLKVSVWELANEPFAFNKWATGTGFANAMNIYNTSLKLGSAQAKSSLMFAGIYSGFNNDFSAFDGALASHGNQFWDSVSTHVYPVGLGSLLDSTARIKALNGILVEGTNNYIDSYFGPKIGNRDIFLSELNSSPDANPFLQTLYNGLFLGEYIARLSTHRKIKKIGVHALYLGNTSTSGIVRATQDNDGYFIN